MEGGVFLKRPVLLILLALVVGFALGLFCTYSIVTPNQNNALAAGSMAATPQFLPLSSPTSSPSSALDYTDDELLMERADLVLCAMRDGDFQALAAAVHPVKGVTLTPYSTVDAECNQVLTPGQVAALGDDETVYTWGVADGTGDPIQLTSLEYFDQYVFNADYTIAPQVSLDEVQVSGNAMENVADAYPEGRFVEYHFPGLDQKQEGYDWCSLKLVFEPYQGNWYLVGLIHSEWTI